LVEAGQVVQWTALAQQQPGGQEVAKPKAGV